MPMQPYVATSTLNGKLCGKAVCHKGVIVCQVGYGGHRRSGETKFKFYESQHPTKFVAAHTRLARSAKSTCEGSEATHESFLIEAFREASFKFLQSRGRHAFSLKNVILFSVPLRAGVRPGDLVDHRGEG